MRILILGGGGMLGHKLWQILNQRFSDVHVTLLQKQTAYSQYPLFSPPNVYDEFDATNRSALWRLLDTVVPDIICNCIGLTLRKQVPSPSEAYIQLNSLLPHRLAEWCGTSQARLIHYSTDCVFKGDIGGYTEESTPDAKDIYGRSKMLGEVDSPKALILRSSIIGRELKSRTELVEWLLAQNNKTITGYRQAFYTGVTTLQMSHLTSDIIANHSYLNGLYHIASDVISKYELLRLLAKEYGVNVNIVPSDAVIVKKNLIGSKFRTATGLHIPSWSEMISSMALDNSIYKQETQP
ncbi:MAG: SDR family oxidoreductase [Bdellovibrionales bacterium]|nr:SDR family oxidoreductase [Bdellovibrionales bacterium]